MMVIKRTIYLLVIILFCFAHVASKSVEGKISIRFFSRIFFFSETTENQDSEYLTEDTGLYAIAVRIETYPVVFFLHLESYLDELSTVLNRTVSVLRSDGIDQIFAVVNGVYTPITKVRLKLYENIKNVRAGVSLQ